ncbi:MAG: hypothetical protein CMJ17_01270 [Phenylobacterium sp.]|nr:hypothetical protein [Phenylobacterium sp.]
MSFRRKILKEINRVELNLSLSRDGEELLELRLWTFQMNWKSLFQTLMLMISFTLMRMVTERL